MDFEKKLIDDLHKYLLSEKLVDEKLPECPDLEELWKPVVRAYLPDGVREFQNYPVSSLGWIMFVGMGLAKLWDVEWEKYSSESGERLYESFRDAKGYDNMDDYILEEILGLDKEESKKMGAIVGECAARTLSAIQHSGIEPGTKDASLAYISALHALYTMGIAIELNALGYHMTQIG